MKLTGDELDAVAGGGRITIKDFTCLRCYHIFSVEFSSSGTHIVCPKCGEEYRF